MMKSIIILAGMMVTALGFSMQAYAETILISHWAGENNAVDSFGTNNGVLHNGTSFVTGVNGQAFSFDGVDDSVDIWNNNLPPEQGGLAFTGSFSISASVQIESFPGLNNWGHIMFRGDGQLGRDPYWLTTTSRYVDSVLTPGVAFFVVDSNNTAASLFAPVQTADFFDILATLDDTTGEMNLFFDGNLVDSTTTTKRPFQNLNTGYWIGIGNHPTFHYQPFDGQIDEVKLYSGVVNSVPEPATMLLFGTGLAGLFGTRIGRKKRKEEKR